MAESVRLSLPRLSVEEWWERREELVVIDVRSPQEYERDHLPFARNYPVLTNEERARVGTLYARSPFAARILGARIISSNISAILADPFWEEVREQEILVYCWRGGQRSLALGVVLKEIGFKVYILQGGYRSFRRLVHKELGRLPLPYDFWVLTGPTGSGKTELIELFSTLDPFPDKAAALNLEALAGHCGSVFGHLPHSRQPSQKHFESRLWYFFRTLKPGIRYILCEDECRRIGALEIPPSLWEKITCGRRILITAPFESRVRRILCSYPIPEESQLKELLLKLLPHLGTRLYEQLLLHCTRKDWYGFISILLESYYDPLYLRHLKKRDPHLARVWDDNRTAGEYPWNQWA